MLREVSSDKRKIDFFSFDSCFLAASEPLLAHHGHVEYDGKAVTLRGTVTKFEWTNPHCILAVAVKGDKDKVENWYAEFLPPAQMSEVAGRRKASSLGTRLRWSAVRSKKCEHIMWIESLVLPDGRKIDRDAGVH